VRELENAIERASVFSTAGVIQPEDLPKNLIATLSIENDSPGLLLEAVERRHILSVLESVNGNRNRAAGILGIGTATLWRKLKQFGIKQ
jgi:two-component system response regulator HydG